MSERSVIEFLEKERRAVEALLERVPEERWLRARRADGWSAAEILGHMAVTTDGLTSTAQGYLEDSVAAAQELAEFDLERFNDRHHLRHAVASFDEVREEWRSLFGRASDFASTLSDAQWQHSAKTPWGAGSTVEDVMKIATAHHRTHRLELESLLPPKEMTDANR